MFKIKLRKFLKELFCHHKNLDARNIDVGTQRFVIINCLDCGKEWIRKI